MSGYFDGRGTRDIALSLAAVAEGRPFTAPYSTADMADDVAGLLAHLEAGLAHIVGASLGGIIGRWFAVRHPHRCASLTAIMTGHSRTAEGPELSPMNEQARANMLTKAEILDRETAVTGYIAAWRSYNGSGFELDEDPVRSCGERTFDRAYHPPGVARQVAAMIPGLLQAERRITAPALIFYGDEDPLFGADHARLIAGQIPDAELEIVEGMGHEMPPAAWDRLQAAIERNADRAD